VKHLVDKDPEFESIKESQAYDAVVELIEQTFNTEGRLMSVAEAAKEVENHLVEQAFKMSQWKKVQARMQPKVEAPQEVQKPQTMEPKPAIRTLSNDLTQQSSGRMTEKQRIARAMAAFNGQKIS
jgi:aspartokinase